MAGAAALALGLWAPTQAAFSATTQPPPLQVTATATPASGDQVRPGTRVTYTLHAASNQELPDGGQVVDDVSGVLDQVSMLTPAKVLSERGLTLDSKAKTVTWQVPPLTMPSTTGSTATTSFQVTVAKNAGDGASLTTSAAPVGGTCPEDGDCATTLTVTNPPATPTTTPTGSASPTSASTPDPPTATPTQTPSSTSPTAAATTTATPAPSTPVSKRVATPTAAITSHAGQAGRRSTAAARIVPCTGAAPAPGSPVGGFEIDGNLCTDGASTTDWDTAGTQPVANDGADDSTQFTQGAKETNWPWSPGQTQGNGTAPGKADITNVYAYTRTSGDVYAYVGFERVATNGSVGFHLELNQKPNTFGPTPNRTVGDLRLTLEGGGLFSLSAAERWTGTAWSSLGSVAGIVGQVNQDPVTSVTGATLLPGQFAELAIDLTQLLGTTCSGSFATLNLRSSSSSSENSSLGDWVNPVALSVPDTCPSVRVDKRWVIDGTTYTDGSQPPGFSAALSLTGRTSPAFGVVYTTRSNGIRYAVGDAVDVGETVSPLPPGCANVASGDIGSHILSSGLNSFTITNTVTCTYLTLRKAVVGGLTAPAQWTLSAAGPTAVSGAGNSAAVTRVHVAPGTYTLGESGPTGYRQTSLTCTPRSASGSAVSLAAGDDVTCTFTNTAVHPVVLTKEWVNAIVGDSVSLQVTDGPVTAGGTSTAPATTTAATLQALAGDTIGLAETFTVGAPANYATTLACDHGVTPAGGSFTVPALLAAGTTITCTFTNARHSATLTLQKGWVNGAAADTADLSIDGATSGPGFATAIVPAPAGTGSSTDRATAEVFSGDTVALAETLGPGNTGTYDATLACTDPAGLTYTAGALSGSYTVPATPDNVVCTFTNTRRSATLTLQKEWVNGAAGDQAGLSITGTDPATSGSATSTASGAAGSQIDTGNRATATIFSGETVTVSEALPPTGQTNTGSYTSRVSCTPLGVTGGRGGQAATGLVPDDPVPVVCTITNTRTSASLVLRKAWVVGAAGDTADLSLDGTTTGPGFATATVPGGGSGLSIDRATITLLSGQTITLAEQLSAANTGSYTSAIGCDRAGLTPDPGGQGGTFVVPATPEAVTCTITNTRTSQTLILQKSWLNGAAGDLASLTVHGTDEPTLGRAASIATGTAGTETDTANQAIATVYSGETVTLAEQLGARNIGTYTSATDCNQPGLTPDPGGQGGTFLVPAQPAAVTCTITNSRTSATVTVQKSWVNGASGDTSDLSIAGSDPGTSGSATSTATGTAGSETDTANQATATVFSGEVVTLAEALGAGNTGSYTSATGCDQPGLTPDADGRGGTFLVPGQPAAVTCTIINSRTSATLILQKSWVNGASGDTTDLSIAGSDPGTSGSATSTATGAPGSENDTANQATATVFSGATITLTEVLGAGNTGSYASATGCTPTTGFTPDPDGQGGTFIVLANPEAVTCTITNTRTSATLILQKSWLNGAAGDTADLSVSGTNAGTSGLSTSTATGAPGSENDTANQATTTVFSGDTVTLAEVLGAANTGTYTSATGCTPTTGFTADPDGQGGTFLVPAQPAAVTCTITNTRTSATLTLQKAWVDAVTGDTALLSITGSGPAVSEENTSTATGAVGLETDTANQATATVYSGQQLVLAETFGANTGTYTIDLACTGPAALSYRAHGATANYTVPAQPVAVTCTFTNTRTSATITLQKEWVNGAAGDTSELSIGGSDPGTSGQATSTATGAAGTETDTANRATAAIFSGETVDLVETLGQDNTGGYTAQIACTPATGLTPGQGGQGGTYHVPAIPVPVVCTITNTRTSATLTLQKSWVNGVAGDTADLAINGATTAPGAATATVPASGSGVSTDKATSVLLSGQTITLTETLGSANTGSYTSTIACDQPGLTADPDGRGGTFPVPATPESVTCAITNSATAVVPSVTKSVTSSTEQPNGTWTTVYAVAVTTSSTAPPTMYTLTDTLAFGSGITVNTATVTGPDDEDVNPGWNGSTDTMVVADGTLGTGQTDHYAVTVNATVPADATSADLSCSDGGGFLNTAQVSVVTPARTGATAPRGGLARAGAAAPPVADPTTADATACADVVLPENGEEGGGEGGGEVAGPDVPLLAFTGAAVAGILLVGAGLLAIGLILQTAGRRIGRRTQV